MQHFRLTHFHRRRNEVARQIALNTALSEPVDDRAAPRLLDTCIRAIQVAFDTPQADGRVRASLLLLLCECLLDSRESIMALLDSSHLTETLLAVNCWKSHDSIISGLGYLVWAFCLEFADSDAHKTVLRRIIMNQMGLDTFKNGVRTLLSIEDFRNARDELSYEPLQLTKIILFDSYFSEHAVRAIDQCDSRVLSLVMSRDEDLSSEPKALQLEASNELIQANSRIAELESKLATALSALASKTDEAALTRYRLDLAQRELESLTEGEHTSTESLEHKHSELQANYNELRSQYDDLLMLLVRRSLWKVFGY
jgi:hypothetical protein